MGWTELLSNVPTEFVIGYIEDGDVGSWAQFSEAYASRKVAFSFRFTKLCPEAVQIVSETRVECRNRVEAIKFWFYWILIRPFSGLIRKEILRVVRVQAEAEWANLRAYLKD
ncbi:MAG: hypothetical protein CVU22_20855 [Betaproteobacteria bacterium HGW-Betaproteobacteria-16]|nr:MAG: hypothetical protein CVU22_20855 [Betaproteobacteria bacterium HGW-Betaproteobacteria-16]